MSKPIDLRVVIIGAGIAGLSAALALLKKNPGHNILILERSDGVILPGSAIGVISNCCRALDYLGLYDKVSDRCKSNPQARYFRRWENGAVLAEHLPMDMDKLFGYPTYNILRGDLYRFLEEAVVAHGAKIRFNSMVECIDVDAPAVKLVGGQTFDCDLVLAADGVNSVARSQIFPQYHKKTATYDIRFIAIPEDRMRSDPLTSPLLDSRSFWFGPGKAIAAGPVRSGGKTMYCMDWSTIVEENAQIPLGVTFQNTHPDLLVERFKGWDPAVLRTLQYIKDEGKTFNQWCLTSQEHPSQWHSNDGRVILIGDAIRADLPFSGQGAAMAIEDSICLAECLSRLQRKSEMLRLVQSWQKIRQPRTQFIQKQIKLFKNIFHLPDGPGQTSRDEKWSSDSGGADFRDLWNGQHIDDPPQDPMDPMWQPYLAGHDILTYSRRKLDEWFGPMQCDTWTVRETSDSRNHRTAFNFQPRL